LIDLVLGVRLEQAPGELAVYSDLGYLALGWMLEEVFGAPLDELFSRQLASPLGLVEACYRRISDDVMVPEASICATEIWPRRCPDGLPLCGVVHDDNCAALDGVAGHAGVFATLPDCLRWALWWLRAVLGQESVAVGGLTAEVARDLVSRSAAVETTWRCGWDTPSAVGSSAGDNVTTAAFGHLGFTGTSVWFDPELEVAVVLLTNRVHPSREPAQPIKELRASVHSRIWHGLREAVDAK
jgi:CubicO group peptidase (beta-lactamase class C family)